MKIEFADVDGLSPDDVNRWNLLHEAQQGLSNPFTAPEWVLAWFRHFTEQDQRLLLLVRSDEQLVGVAPFYRSRVRLGGFRWRERLQLVGAGQGGSLLELPQVLTAPGNERAVLRAVVDWLVTERHPRDGWVDVCLAPHQGWFEGDWLSHTGHPAAFARQHASRACVVVDLAPTWEQTSASLKRNVKESLRRSRNRIAKDGRPWAVRLRTDDLDADAVNRLLALHRQRSGQTGRPQHWDAFADTARRDFLRDVLPQLGRSSRAQLLELHDDGEVVASQLTLLAPSLLYVHSSGFAESVWNLGPVTYLQEQAFRAACERGDTAVNLSPGPNVAKLRWSERVAVYHDFAFGAGPASMLRWYTAFAAGQAVAQTRHEAAMLRRQAAAD